jgi:hypothetical protein
VCAGVKALMLKDLFGAMRASGSWSLFSLPSAWNDSLCIEPLRSLKARPLGMEKDEF